MSTQQYRGNRITVRSFGFAGHYAYVASVVDGCGGELRYEVASGYLGFRNSMAAEDEAFTSARAWIELHPLARAWSSSR
jgi:hypothetical protein